MKPITHHYPESQIRAQYEGAKRDLEKVERNLASQKHRLAGQEHRAALENLFATTKKLRPHDPDAARKMAAFALNRTAFHPDLAVTIGTSWASWALEDAGTCVGEVVQHVKDNMGRANLFEELNGPFASPIFGYGQSVLEQLSGKPRPCRAKNSCGQQSAPKAFCKICPGR